MWCSNRKQVLKPFYREKQRDFPGSSPGFTGKFTGIHREVHLDVPESFLGYGFLFSGFTGKFREVPVSLPRKLVIYRDIAMSSPVFHRWMTGEFSIPWEIFVLVFAWNVTYLLGRVYAEKITASIILEDKICYKIIFCIKSIISNRNAKLGFILLKKKSL